MDSWQARFDSFTKRKRVKQGSTTTVLKWPHPTSFLATPETLAEAGFYFTPTLSTPDAVRCFTCGKELSDWEQDDDPFLEHIRRGSTCYWAVVRCGLRDDMDEDGNYTFPNPTRAPSGKTMEKARLDSYASRWPHDEVKGHSANSKKMAQAGFVYTPQGPNDDTATCFYCGTSLSGWEDGDDPLKEHHKREEKSRKQCSFFISAPQPQRARSAGRSQSRAHSKPPSTVAATSKKKSKVLQSDEHSSSLSSDEDIDVSAAPSNSKSRASTVKKSTSSRGSSAPAKTPASRKSTRSASATKQASTSVGLVASETDDDFEASSSETGKRVSKSKKKGAGKGKEKAKERIEVIQEEEEEENVAPKEQPVEPPPPPKPKRGRPPKNKATINAAKSAASPPDALEDPAPSRTRSKAHAEPESDVPLASSSDTKAKSSTKGKAKGASIAEYVVHPSQKAKGSSKSNNRVNRRTTESNTEEERPEPAPKVKAVSKPKAETKLTLAASDPDMDMEVEPEEELRLDSPPQADLSQPGQRVPPPGSESAKLKNRKSSSTSDDAGYATAEHGMEVDLDAPEISHLSPNPQPTQATSKLVPQRSSSVDDAPSRQGSVKPGRSSSRPGLSMVRTSSRLNAEVVDISSSDEEMLLPRLAAKPSHPAAEKRAAPPELHASDQAITAASIEEIVDERPNINKPPRNLDMSRPPSRTTGRVARLSRLVVDVVAPPTSSKRLNHEDAPPDVDMVDVEQMPPEDAGTKGRAQKSSDGHTSRTPTPATPPPRTPSLPPTDTELNQPNVKSSAPALPSFDEEMESESAPSANNAFAPFTPFLSLVPLQKLTSLSEEECDMTLEQYIRGEIEKQYRQFKEDAERKIATFHAKAAETRSIIEAA